MAEEAKLGGLQEQVSVVVREYAKELRAVRDLLDGNEPDDVIVYRFLRGYQFDVPAAAKALQSAMNFYAEHNTREIRELAGPLTQYQFPFGDKIAGVLPHRIHHKEDRKGQPMSLERLGKVDPVLFLATVPLEEMVQYHLYHMEKKAQIVAHATALTGTVVRACKIMDLEGLGTQHLNRQAMKYFKTILDISQDNYPEMLGNLYVVNAPWAFTMAWKLVRPWLRPATLEKISILGTDYQEKLFQAVDPANLPPWLGGTCTCECVRQQDPVTSMTKVVVARRAHSIEEKVTSGCVVSWTFFTDKDIGFSAIFRGAGSEADVVLAQEDRVASHTQQVSGKHVVVNDGNLVLTWDNTFSWLTPKILYYKVHKEVIQQTTLS